MAQQLLRHPINVLFYDALFGTCLVHFRRPQYFNVVVDPITTSLVTEHLRPFFVLCLVCCLVWFVSSLAF